jgi:hypothetical protein
MLSKDEIVRALQSPQRAPFSVCFEIFSSEDRGRIAKFDRKWSEEREQFENDHPECDIKLAEEFFRISNLTQPAARLLERLDLHTHRFNALKQFFLQEIGKHGIAQPLIFFDEMALRIDIGYGPKEISALFPDFLYGVFGTEILGGVSIFGRSPEEYLFRNHIHHTYKHYLNREKDEILLRARRLFSSIEPKLRKTTPSLIHDVNEAHLIQQCLETNQGLIVGEVHEDKSPKQFLIDNMSLFKRAGVSHLFMEHLLKERHQVMLDEYFATPSNSNMPIELRLYLDSLDKERQLSGTASFTAVVESAKQHQIRIIAIDSEAIYGLGVANSLAGLNPSRTIERYAAMNMSMFEQFCNVPGKFIAFVGSAHVATCEGVPGISELVGCPHIVVQDLVEGREFIEENIFYEHKIWFEKLYHRHPVSKQFALQFEGASLSNSSRQVGFFNSINVNHSQETLLNPHFK